MPRVGQHLRGEFCWLELATTDQNAAQNFYQALFGWSVRALPIGPEERYSIVQLDGRDVAAAFALHPEERARGIPPHWAPYIAVESADTAAEQATKLGGHVIEVLDVPNAGRMAVIRDPTGAVLWVFQARQHAGLGITGEPGAFCCADLITPDPERAAQFYSGLLGWQVVAGEHDTSGYLHIQNGGKFIGGIPHPRHQGSNSPPHWLSYFAASDVDAITKRAQGLGAKIWGPPMSIEGAGRIAILGDPQGAAFALFQESRRA